ncbi:proline-rich transmembrane protein 1-like isoform X2 [Ptychodera flava]
MIPPEPVSITPYMDDDRTPYMDDDRTPYMDDDRTPLTYPDTSNSTTVAVLQPVTGSIMQQRIPNDYMGLAIFALVCCFKPLGIFAVLKSRDVHKRVWEGDMEGSREASRWARLLSLISLAIGIVIIICATTIATVYVIKNISMAIDAMVTEAPNISSDGF